MYTENNELIGIDKTICSKINLQIVDNKAETVTFYNKAESKIYPENEFPENARKLRGFIWRGDERIKSKDDIFPEDETILHNKIMIETKKKEALEDVPMDVLKETIEYDKKNPKTKVKK